MGTLVPDLTDQNLINFWKKVDKQGNNDCWPWLAYCNKDGYGQFGIDGRIYYAQRVMLAIIGQRSVLNSLHLCNNPKCVNPRHLRFGTQADNIRDRTLAGNDAKGSKNGSAKLTESDIPIIRKLTEIMTQREIGILFGVTHSQINRIMTGRRWKHVIRVATDKNYRGRVK